MKAPENYKCDQCLNHRPVVSENGLHFVCSLPDRQAVLCFAGMIDRSVLLRTEEDDENEST